MGAIANEQEERVGWHTEIGSVARTLVHCARWADATTHSETMRAMAERLFALLATGPATVTWRHYNPDGTEIVETRAAVATPARLQHGSEKK